MKTRKCKVLVVGGGPGGYPAAIRAAQLGLDTVIVEGDRLGGTCLIRGCIPSKAMIHAATEFAHVRDYAENRTMGISVSDPEIDMEALVGWKSKIVDRLSGGVAMLLNKAGVESVAGWARFENAKTCVVERDGEEDLKITAEHVILANGSAETELPFLPFDGDRVISSTHALDLKEIPKHLVVIGAGYIGLELGIAYAKLGSKVTFVEAMDRILPLFDEEMTKPVLQWLKKHDVDVRLGCKAKGLTEKDGKTHLAFETADGGTDSVRASKVLVAVGRKPRTEGWGLENMGVDMDGAFVKVDAQCRTAMRNVWAIGDLVGEPLLAHKATAQGEMAAEIIAGHRRVHDPVAIAAVCFTEPEVIGAGLTPEDAEAAGEEIVIGRFPMSASGRALAVNTADAGFVRITARKSDHVILGIHAVGSHIAELSGEFALALEMGARLEDIAGAIHVHPTLTETFAESALAALGHPIHVPA